VNASKYREVTSVSLEMLIYPRSGVKEQREMEKREGVSVHFTNMHVLAWLKSGPRHVAPL